MKKKLTLCIVTKGNDVLLGMKKRGFGVGQWNGFGGKLNESESVEDGARRELKEESGIEALNMEKVGIIDFEFENGPKQLEVHIFHIDEFSSEPVETEEMRPEWFKKDAIPYGQMWSDDIYWLPMLLSGKKFRGKFLFDMPSDVEHSSKIITQELMEVESL